MPISSESQFIPFNLEMILTGNRKVDTDFSELLKLLSSLFAPLYLLHVEITSITHSSPKFYLENGNFVSRAPCSFATKTIDFSSHGPNPILWTGKFELGQRNPHEMDYLLRNLSAKLRPELQVDLIWRFSNDYSPEFQELVGVVAFDYKRARVELNSTSFAFGTIVNGNHFISHFQSNLTGQESLTMGMMPITEKNVHFNHTSELIELQFHVCRRQLLSHVHYIQEFQLRYGYNSIERVTICKKTSEIMILYFHLSRPPKIFTDKYNLDGRDVYIDKRNLNDGSGRDRWTRWHDCFLISRDIVGKSNVLRLEIQSNTCSRFQAALSALYAWRRFSPLDISFGPVYETSFNGYQGSFPANLPEDVNYGIECLTCFDFSFQNDLEFNNGDASLFNDFIRQQVNFSKNGQIVESLHRLFSSYRSGKVHRAYEYFKWIFDRVCCEWETIKKMRDRQLLKTKFLRRCILTPTRVLPLPSCPFQSSLFLESINADYALRALIRDEDFSSLSYAVSVTHSDSSTPRKKPNPNHPNYRPNRREYFLRKVIEDRLIGNVNGLQIAGRLYQYYGASSSQFREGGMMLYARDNLGRTAQSIRSSLGVINEKSVAKYASRVGLSLSQVFGFVTLPPGCQIYIMSDVCGGRHSQTGKPYNFTDGCGAISTQLAYYIWQKLKEDGILNAESTEERMPSAYQIRFMGTKGMVCIDTELEGMTIVIRESMLKMKAPKSDLGILKISEPRRAYLNAPFITILNQIGLPTEFFMKLLLETIENLIASFDDSDIAVSALEMFGSLHRLINYKKLARAGFQLHHDPFFRSIIILIFNQGLDIIKRKARIPLNMKDARTMFGVCDPTINRFCQKRVVSFNYNGVCDTPTLGPSFDALGRGILKKGEVFVWPSDFERPVTGEVIVTKFPSTHSGDAQRLIAIDYKELHHIKDCIVFPVDGNRPHSDEMAGSDLDGDEYCVIWGEEFKRIFIKPPMEYPAGQNGTVCDNITEREMVRFHMRYLQECAIGKIAKAHLAWSDLKGIDSAKCKKLAIKYAGALDFAKQGIEDEYRFSKEDLCPEVPDFMQRHDSKPSYHSIRALGAIYQVISQFQIYLADEIKVKQVVKPNIDLRLVHPQWGLYEDAAVSAYAKYEAIVGYLLHRCEFASESELLSQIFEKNRLFRQNFDDRIRANDFEDSSVSMVKKFLVQEMERDFDNGITSVSPEDLAQARMAKASAYYMVTLEKAKNSKLKCYGLPWIGRYNDYFVQMLNNNVNVSQPLVDYQRLGYRRMGFTGDNNEIETSCKNTWNKLDYWIRQFFGMTQIVERDELYNQLHKIYHRAIIPYCTGERTNGSSGKILLKIFNDIQEDNCCGLEIQRTSGLFSSHHNPMGQMVMALLEQELSNSLIREDDNSIDLFTNRCFKVRITDARNGRISVINLVDLLNKLTSGTGAEITTFDTGDVVYIPLAVYGPPASLMIAQIAVGIHNRLCSQQIDL
ncbi:uncharacterized protein LOC107371323 [Tetranychus urticae]|uniref:uncharacterized protein LOC107371323 n=1 Tax=Tetranychus urticae TaxID=32264 RepID=UPI00077BE69A|nr:uncharacterized protein LOC107371323 [Tetranychus urticae]XP_015794859.1 uncharacterized protein LOC107371323 [Tetranychus urticae]